MSLEMIGEENLKNHRAEKAAHGRILYVDYDKSFATVMAKYLTWYGFEVELLHESSRVLEKVEDFGYVLVILHENLVPVSGKQLCATMRESSVEKLQHINLLIVSEEVPDHEDYVFYRKMHANYINRYKGPEAWYEKITIMLGAR